MLKIREGCTRSALTLLNSSTLEYLKYFIDFNVSLVRIKNVLEQHRFDNILNEIAPLRYKDIIQGSDIELLNLLSDTNHKDLVLFFLECNDKKIWTLTDFRYFNSFSQIISKRGCVPKSLPQVLFSCHNH